MLYALAAAAGTAVYAVLLPSVNIHAAAVAVAIGFVGICSASVANPSNLERDDVFQGVVLAIIFGFYQLCLQKALQETTMSQAVVNLNVAFLAVHFIVKTRNYAKAPELFAAVALQFCLSLFIAGTHTWSQHQTTILTINKGMAHLETKK